MNLSLHAPCEPYHSFQLNVGHGHTLYVEEVGNPHGMPIVFLHGGPGGGCSPKHRQIFNPQKFRAILFDQRGCGRSTPHACLEHNTTWDLVSDIEKIRCFLGMDFWAVWGGSWGSTLALAYAQTHPTKVTDLFLRGIFLCRPKEIQWFYQSGAHHIFPDAWEQYVEPIPLHQRHNLLRAFHEQLTSPEPEVQQKAALAWSRWEGATSKLIPSQQLIEHFIDPAGALALARIECHYFMNNCFFEDNQLLRNAHKLAHIPTHIVHGRYDVVCPVQNAWELAKAMPHAQLSIIPDAGHAFDEPGTLEALLKALEQKRGTDTHPENAAGHR